MERDFEPAPLHRTGTGARRRIVDPNDTEGEEDSEFDDEDNNEEQLKNTLKDALSEIIDGKVSFTPENSQSLANFDRQYGGILLHPPEKGSNALHLLVTHTELRKPEPELLGHFVTYLVKHGNALLETQDGEGCTPLIRAISAKKKERRDERMAEWMINAHPNIGPILAISDRQNQNFPQPFAAKDSSGNTPLHYAVKYDFCYGQKWLGIIEELAKKSEKAVPKGSEEAVPDLNEDGLSPYLYHIKTRKQNTTSGDKDRNKEKGGGEVPNNQRSPQGKTEFPRFNPKSVFLTPDTVPRPTRPPKTEMQSRSRIQEAPRPSDSIWLAVPGGLPPIPPDGPQENGSAITTTSAADQKSGGYKKSTKEQETSRADEDISKRVEQFLKLHYLRNRSEQQCSTILSSRKLTPGLEDQLLNFDLFGRANMTEDDFGKLIDTLKFHEFLQYIAIPKMRISESQSPTNERTDRDEQGGRTDLSLVFDELRSSKGVKRVLKVVVDDSLSPPHSDETIENSLKHLGVEIWDWKRFDICSEVIYNAAPRVREVHLYSTGNNAVLRSWSDHGGLRRLENLEKVHVEVKQGIETTNRTKQYVEEFKRRMRDVLPDVVLTVQEPKLQLKKLADQGAMSSSAGPAPPMDKNDWIDCMKNFRKMLYTAESNHGNKKKTWESMETQIKIALIDDGVDIARLSPGTARLEGGRTFCSRDETNHMYHPYYASATGHGTLMAQSIHEICPSARLFVLRLEDHLSVDGHARQMTAKSAAKAIYAAIERDVHIISMSWTIDVKDSDPSGSALDRAVKAAAEKGILMFCSASDKGANAQYTYPAKATTNIFKIGAAKDSGAVDEWVGDQSLIDFTFPGNKVDLEGKHVSGSSVATAYAAGLAALILYCVQVRLYLTDDDEEKKTEVREQFEALRKHDKMFETLKHTIGTTEGSGYKFVQVRAIFGDARNKQDKNPDRLLKVIARTGEKLCARV
ncbi:hypothetical protein QBC32DRAFT_327684 [Pseudoneurospora amorphoporcata]|uniref:Peptidase S8/S53 domain-containing protein n=1 Tax=Pseudoneurospora amorphoporcata TaxID=241081 RepID=A0AAN6NRJ9_9PEZI|nr:hypothetical protein QBC32DRAFT_327684 [Pseudoneurospora amorphoporcata]